MAKNCCLILLHMSASDCPRRCASVQAERQWRRAPHVIPVEDCNLIDEYLVIFIVAAVALSEVVQPAHGFMSGDKDELGCFEAGDGRADLIE